MTTPHRLITIAALLAASTRLDAQSAAPARLDTVLFVCEHGTVRSLLARIFFERYAAEAGLSYVAVSRGTRADSVVPAFMERGLTSDHFALGDWRPQTLTTKDLGAASLVVSFDVPSEATAASRGGRMEWNGLPSVSQDYARGRDAIALRVRQLVDSLKRSRPHL